MFAIVLELLKKHPWSRKEELQRWMEFWIRQIPGRAGQNLRRRYYPKRMGGCGKGLLLMDNVRLQKPAKLFLGDDVSVASGADLNAAGELRIGNRVTVGFAARIWTDNHLFRDTGAPLQKQGFEFKSVVLEDDVVLGAKCMIKPGVRVGRGSWIRPGTILSKSVPEFSVVEGNPGVIVSRRRPEA